MSRTVLAIALTLGFAIGLCRSDTAVAVEATKVQDGGSVGLVLSHLPPRESAEYAALRATAMPIETQALEMTQSEMWTVPAERVADLTTGAHAQHIEIMAISSDMNRPLAPMPPGKAMTPEQERMMHDVMQSKAAMGVVMMALPDAKALEYALTKDPGSAAELVIPLDGTHAVTARRTYLDKTAESYVWHGVTVDTEEPVSLLWWPSGRLSGQVTYRGHVFAIKDMGGGMHGVVEMAPRMLPPEHAPMDPGMKDKMKMKDDPLVTKGDGGMLRDAHPEPRQNLEDAAPKQRSEGASRGPDLALALPSPGAGTAAHEMEITVLVAYTRAAASHYTDIEKDLIALAIEEANQSFRASGVPNVRLKLVHTYRTDYVEQGSHFEHVFRFADKGDGYMEEVHALRDQYHADVALLVVHDPNGCGLAAGVAPNADRAFAVVHHECAATSYSVAHEIGHIIGARHDVGLDDGIHPFAFGHGFVHGKEWRTMMSYDQSCGGCPRLPIWSNPRLKVRGAVAGDENTADNARVIGLGAERVARFR